MTHRRSMAERFRNKFVPEPTSGCWIWDGALSSTGYGYIWDLACGKYLRAHRVSWELHMGKIPAGDHVLHKCDNRQCVNPDHLFLGSHADNMQDKIAKGRHQVPFGSNHHSSKLDEQTVQEIKALRSAGWTQISIAAIFGVKQQTVSDVCSGKTWRHSLNA